MSEIAKTENRAAGAIEQAADVKGKIVQFAWHLKKEGYRESTITMCSRRLRCLLKVGCNLWDSESVKEVIASQSWLESTKATYVDAYDSFARFIGISWKPPKYHCERTLPFIPTEKEIDQLIASCGKKTAAFLQLLKETGMRSGEAEKLKWTDIDMERKVVYVKPEKRSNPRILNVSNRLISMLAKLPRKSEKVFSSLPGIRATFHQSRKLAAEKLGNPRLLQIHLHTFRHWKGTTVYHQTKDILHVKQVLGHKSINKTLLYINLENALHQKGEDSEHVTRVAPSVNGARTLLESGFEYVTEMNGLKIFRKRK
ncbi:MAG: site-specific integrase [Candidatus Bathyarchaeia archaeon]|nr:site-specific integrase [Candidatus Bathyarchaeia archaeon]